MNNFIFQCSTKMIFGKGQEHVVGEELKRQGASNVLFVYGGHSIRRTGLYDKVVRSLKDAGIAFTELPGVVPNPRVSLVRKAIEICREKKVDFLLAVGGGSVIDTCKAASYGVFYQGDIWDLISHKVELQGDMQHLPVGDILTLPAAGSEESDSCMISDEELKIKSGFGAPGMRPVFSIMDPELTYTLPVYQTGCGCIDIMSHVMERYFSHTEDTEMEDRMAEAILKTVIDNFEIVLKEPENYGARSEIMLCGTWAQNDMIGSGKEQDWFNHGLEHEISGLYDIAHGAGLAITFPHWMEFCAKDKQCQPKLLQYAERVWGLSPDYLHPEKTISKAAGNLRTAALKAGLPTTLSAANIGTGKFEYIADRMTDGGKKIAGNFHRFTKEDILVLLEAMK